MSEQPSLFEAPSVPAHRVEVLARVLAGFRWPDRHSLDKLKKRQKEACLAAARDALEALEREDD